MTQRRVQYDLVHNSKRPIHASLFSGDARSSSARISRVKSSACRSIKEFHDLFLADSEGTPVHSEYMPGIGVDFPHAFDLHIALMDVGLVYT